MEWQEDWDNDSVYTATTIATARWRGRTRGRCRELVFLAFAQRFQYQLALGALAYLGSKQFADTSDRDRDFTLAVHHLEEAVVAAYAAIAYVLPFAFAASRGAGKRAANRFAGISRTGRLTAAGALLAAVALVPARVSVELFLAATFLGGSCSVAMLVFVYVAAAEKYDATHAAARNDLWAAMREGGAGTIGVQ